MPLIDVQPAGVRLHVQELGSGRDEAPPVVMLHGLLVGSLASWYFTAAPALARRRRVVLYDLRGHGRSERPPSGYDLETLATDLRDLLDTLGVRGPVDLVGHSYGALVALRLALRAPDRVRSLALVEPPLPPSRYGELHSFLGRSPEEMLAALPPELRDQVASGSGGRRVRRFLAGVRALTVETSLLADLAAEADVADAELATLVPPLLGLFGADSACRATGDRLARVVPDARVEILPGGHYLHLDAAEALTERLAGWLDG